MQNVHLERTLKESPGDTIAAHFNIASRHISFPDALKGMAQQIKYKLWFKAYALDVAGHLVVKGSLPTVLVGVGVALAAPIVLPVLAAATKPLVKAAIKGYLGVAESIREATAEAGEKMRDLVAEAKAERAAAAEQAAAHG